MSRAAFPSAVRDHAGAVPFSELLTPAAVGRPRPHPTASQSGPTQSELWVRETCAEHAAPLGRFILNLTGGDQDRAEDILQETMARAIDRAADLTAAGSRSLRPWLVTVARQLAVEPQGRVGRRRAAAAPSPTGSGSASDDDADGPATCLTVVDALRALSHPDRQILVWTYFRGHSLAEAAATLDLAPGTAKSRIHLAMCALREALELQGQRNLRAHTAVGAYALGLLDQAETWAFEDHLVECRHCAAELDSLARVVSALAQVESPAAVRTDVAEPADPRDEADGPAPAPTSRSLRRRPSVAQLLLTGVVLVGVLLTAGAFARPGSAGPGRPQQLTPAVGQGAPAAQTRSITPGPVAP